MWTTEGLTARYRWRTERFIFHRHPPTTDHSPLLVLFARPTLLVYLMLSRFPSGWTFVRVLDQLELTIQARKDAGEQAESYTAQLLAGGVTAIGAKVIEEAAEVVEAAAEPGDAGRAHTVAEAADVLYHLLVLLTARNLTIADVERELGARFGMSGLQEKASRPQADTGSSSPSDA